MKTILYILDTRSYQNRRKFAGAAAAAHARRWNLQLVDAPKTGAEARQLMKLWNPDGIITNVHTEGLPGGAKLPDEIPTLRFQDPDSVHHTIACDSTEIALFAARELLSLELAGYAYVPWTRSVPWTEIRGSAFASALRLHGHRPSVPDRRILRLPTARQTERLAVWLRGLPRPVGVFATNDALAVRVVAACRVAGLSVPEDVAVIGVDNDIETCEATDPTISSVSLDYFEAGKLAVETLDRIMAHRPKKPVSIYYHPLGVTRRESTRRLGLRDGAVSAALERIRREACNGLSAADVIERFGCSRRLAEMRFRNAVGHSVLREIRLVRLARAKELIREGEHKLDYVAHLSGYSTLAAFSVFFRAETGVPPSQWRA